MIKAHSKLKINVRKLKIESYKIKIKDEKIYAQNPNFQHLLIDKVTKCPIA